MLSKQILKQKSFFLKDIRILSIQNPKKFKFTQLNQNPIKKKPRNLKSSSNLKKNIKIFLEITKFKLSTTNTFVALSAFLLNSQDFSLSEIALFCISTQMIAMASQTTNQKIEKEYDKLMIRTCNRPLPKNRIEPSSAQIIAFSLFASSNLIYLKY